MQTYWQWQPFWHRKLVLYDFNEFALVFYKGILFIMMERNEFVYEKNIDQKNFRNGFDDFFDFGKLSGTGNGIAISRHRWTLG